MAQRRSGPGRGQRTSRSQPVEPSAARRAISGREADLIGLGLIVVAVVVGLGVYVGAAGVVGEGLDAIFAGLIGVGRYLLPPVLIVVGVLLIHDGKVAHRNRIVLGCILAAVGLLALLHVAAGPDDFPGGYDAVKATVAGSAASSVRRCDGSSATPVRSCVTVALLLAALVIITQVPLKRVAGRAAQGMRAGFRPAIGAAGRAIKEMATLSSDKDPPRRRRRAPRARLGAGTADRAAGAQLGPVRPRHRGARAQEADARHARLRRTAAAARPGRRHRGRRPAADRPRRGRQGRSVEAAPGHPARAHGGADGRHQDGRGAGPRPGGRAGRARRRDPAGRHDRGPHGHPLRARARPRGEGGQGDRLHKDIAYAMASPDVRILAPDPGPVGHRRRGAQPEPPPGRARRHPGRARGQDGRATRSRSASARTSPAGP